MSHCHCLLLTTGTQLQPNHLPPKRPFTPPIIPHHSTQTPHWLLHHSLQPHPPSSVSSIFSTLPCGSSLPRERQFQLLWQDPNWMWRWLSLLLLLLLLPFSLLLLVLLHKSYLLVSFYWYYYYYYYYHYH